MRFQVRLVAVSVDNALAPPYEQPIANVKVTIDSAHLAYVRADFQVVRDGKAQSEGVDQFTLTREGGAWKIAVVAYTSQPVK